MSDEKRRVFEDDEVVAHNRRAWDAQSRRGSRWTTPVDAEAIARARAGTWELILTPTRAVPRAWFGALEGARVLCLASGGGQQAPLLAAAGAEVVSFDLSDEQLARDATLAAREGLTLSTEQGDMRDLSRFPDASFDLVFNPVSTCFLPQLGALWRECARVLRPDGRLLTGFMNPAFFLFDPDEASASGELVARFALPYDERDPARLTPARRAQLEAGEALEFSHSLEAQIGGLCEAGFVIAGLYEDHWDDEATPLNRLAPTSVALLAIRR